MNGKVIAVIPAAGKGERMGANQNKLLLEVLGRPVLALTLDAFESCPLVDEIIIVANEQDIFSYREMIKTEGFTKIREIVCGGATRAASVYEGVCAAADADIIVIHDGARALVTPELIEETIEKSMDTGAAIAAVPMVDTVKREEDGYIAETVDRSVLWCAQTPQVFRRSLFLDAMENAVFDITDDASALEMTGHPVKIAKGSYENIKITTPFDLAVAEAVINMRFAE